MSKTWNVPFEDALDKTGFGLYSLIYVVMAGFAIIAFACITYSTTYIVPTSACELDTNIAEQGIIAATPIVGLMIGAPFWGYIGDTRGRRSTLILSLLAAALINLITSISVNWVMLLAFQLLATIASAGQFMLAMTLLSENIPMAKRNLSVLLVTSLFLLANGVMAMLALAIIPLSFSLYLPALGIYWNSWRTLQAVYSIPSIIMAIFFYFLTESPKFFYARGQEEKALEILKVIHRRNQWRVKEEYQVKSLLKEDKKEIVSQRASAKDQIVPLFKAPLLKYTVIMTTLLVLEGVGSMQIWFPTIANQFMQMMEAGAPMNMTLCAVLRAGLETAPDPDLVPCSLNSTAMLIVLASCALQSSINLLIALVVNKLGRRNLVIIGTAFCGVCGILVNLVPNTIASATLYILFLQGFLVVGLYTAIGVAIFPTHLRTLAIALPLTGGRVGTVISIQVLNYLRDVNCEAGFYIFATLFASSAIVASFLPDDRRLSEEKTETSTKL
ncbi:putative transporter svop-1 [Ostrinia furnacalis]|uniref:putative transporter svop-1 n=1 Tax=Ostrinia furnacalis TaxID=93504 RepID=UPI001040B2D0|nr:putative transporter svop-1 [Ostrinia furnacalis]